MAGKSNDERAQAAALTPGLPEGQQAQDIPSVHDFDFILAKDEAQLDSLWNSGAWPRREMATTDAYPQNSTASLVQEG